MIAGSMLRCWATSARGVWVSQSDRETSSKRSLRKISRNTKSVSPVLLWCLDELSNQLERDPLQSEVVIARLADYLRLAMESSDSRGVTPEREVSLAAALSRLEDSIGAPPQLFTVA